MTDKPRCSRCECPDLRDNKHGEPVCRSCGHTQPRDLRVADTEDLEWDPRFEDLEVETVETGDVL